MIWFALIATSLVGILFLVLLGVLAITLWPRKHPFKAGSCTAEEYRRIEIANGVCFDQKYPVRSAAFSMTDGEHIAARVFGSDDAADIVLLVHGMGGAGERWNNPAGLLSDATGALVVVVDLRGHNDSGGQRYDLDRIGQYEEDLAQIFNLFHDTHPDARLWLAGHSMGGGIALRYALKQSRPKMAGYLLFAPYFGPGPTAPAHPQPDSILHIDKPRVSGLIALNSLRVRAFNHLPVAYLNASPEFPAYSFRAMASGLPLPPLTAADGLAAMEGPVLIIAGEDDTAVNALGYGQVCEPFANVEVEILPGHGHDSLLNDPRTYEIARTLMGRVSRIAKTPQKELLS